MNGEVKTEILAPAGDVISLKAAVHNGADAVYLGLSDFNARTKAKNFSLDELKDALDFAHFFGVRVYAAFNTLLKNREISTVADLIGQATALGVDAVILQDLGLLYELQRRGIPVECHASTQLGVHNLMSAIAAEKLGFSRVILSRETTLDDIRKIKKGTGLALEYFVQGALCVAYSGNCYFSSLITGESGNRGRCLQFCRKPYALHLDGKKANEGYLLSPRDLNLSGRLTQLREAGVSSFKIEGRMRRAEYAGEATRMYKKALEESINNNDQDRLKIMFNRGDYCEGYLSNPTADIIDSDHPAHIGLRIGSVTQAGKFIKIRYDGDLSLSKDDGVKFMRNGSETGSARIATPDAVTYTGDVKPGDEVRLTSCAALNAEILAQRRTLALTVRADFKVGQPASYTVSDGKITVLAYSQSAVQSSVSAPLTHKNLDILSKTANENFVITDMMIDLAENCFLSVSEIKAMRNAAISKFRVLKLDAYQKTIAPPHLDKKQGAATYFAGLVFLSVSQGSIFVMADNTTAITDELLKRADYVVLNPSAYTESTVSAFVARVGKERAILNLPNIMRGKDADILSKIIENSSMENYIVNHPYGFELCRGKTIIAGFQANFLNDIIPNVTKIASVESEKPHADAINYIYGQIPLMTLSFCPRKNLTGGKCAACNTKQERLTLTDDRGTKFALRQYKAAHCYWQLLNSLPLDNRELLQDTKYNVLIDLTAERNPTEKLRDILSNSHSNLPHTHGNYKKHLL